MSTSVVLAVALSTALVRSSSAVAGKFDKLGVCRLYSKERGLNPVIYPYGLYGTPSFQKDRVTAREVRGFKNRTMEEDYILMDWGDAVEILEKRGKWYHVRLTLPKQSFPQIPKEIKDQDRVGPNGPIPGPNSPENSALPSALIPDDSELNVIDGWTQDIKCHMHG
jgi:hypothetical protein